MRGLPWLAVPLLLAACTSSPPPEPETPQATHGRELALKYCGSCHAVGRAGGSRAANAPPFRTLSQRYPIEDLAESLAEGIVAGHDDEMPEIKFPASDVSAMIAYLESIQTHPSKPE